ncbi:hypothetical protein J2Y48_001821 [Mycoplana sp. BE70]|uniref:EF-hand domain-containing protein n=1 Tax=Mycoplana sp. BE70 TaxID=2817775 RepID=UPI0028593974|nr:EF-hand domain-containing protein [Mycoplana sp. BE70]MDR6756528.1 hypothetical protein [Mycoplana sp. BE70]
MASAKLACMATAAMVLSISPINPALAQTDESTAQTQPAEPDQSQMSPDAMMGGGGRGMMGRMGMGPMRGQMMRIMFAVADTDGDGALSFEEVTAVHKRIFDTVDANKDGKVTLDEMRAFMQGQ